MTTTRFTIQRRAALALVAWSLWLLAVALRLWRDGPGAVLTPVR